MEGLGFFCFVASASRKDTAAKRTVFGDGDVTAYPEIRGREA